MFQGSHMARLRLKAYGEFQGSHMACLCLKAYGEFLFVMSSSLPMVFILWTSLSFTSQWNLGNVIFKV